MVVSLHFATGCITALLVVCMPLALTAQAVNDNCAIAIITSVAGDSDVVATDGKRNPTSPHDTYALEGQTVETEKNSHLFIVCSNGLGIGIDAQTSLHVKTFRQTPYTAKRANLEYEPSTSQLIIELDHGALSISSKRLSPRSQIRIKTLNGTVRVHTSNCRIEQDETGTTIISYDGNATFYYPDGVNREFVAKNTAIHISPQSAALNKIAEKIDVTTLKSSKQTFTEAAAFASTRVFFKAPPEGLAAIPVLIIPMDTFDRPTVRPYEYLD